MSRKEAKEDWYKY